MPNPRKDTSVCSKHNEHRQRDVAGSWRCKSCTKEAGDRLALRRRQEIAPTAICRKHQIQKHWDANGKARCRECISEHGAKRDKEYKHWYGMNQRCHNPNNDSYQDYGARGIEVHESWRRDPVLSKEENYSRFLAFRDYIRSTIGVRPSNAYTLDRIHNDKGYEPGNLRWSTSSQQRLNSRGSLPLRNKLSDDTILIHDGKSFSLRELSNEFGLNLKVLKYRFSHTPDYVWIVSDNVIGRIHEYKGNKYTQAELAIITGFSTAAISDRLRLGWIVSDVIEVPLKHRRSTRNRTWGISEGVSPH